VATALSAPVREFLDKPNFAVLVTRSRSNRIQATPVWFVMSDGRVLVNTAKGRTKLRNMQQNPDVVLTILDSKNPYQYVQIHGKAAAFDTEHGARDIDRLSQRYTGKPYGYPGGDRPENRVSIYIEPEHVSGM